MVLVLVAFGSFGGYTGEMVRDCLHEFYLRRFDAVEKVISNYSSKFGMN